MFASADAAYLCYDCDLWEVEGPTSLCIYCQQLREANRRRWITRATELHNLSKGRFPVAVCLVIDQFLHAAHHFETRW